MALTKLFLTVKIYPGFSTTDERMLYTAGVRQNGSWIRIAPLRFERKPFKDQYQKYDLIEMDLVRDKNDKRGETFHPRRRGTPYKVLESVGYENNWEFRKKFALQNVYVGMKRLIDDSRDEDNPLSLATFKASRLVNFFWEPVKDEWTEREEAWLNERNVLERRDGTLKVVRKLPYLFSYVFEDVNGTESTLMVDDWELGQYYWQCLKQRKGDETAALKDVKNRYLFEFSRDREVYFFLNTTRISHQHASNPFFIAGVFYPKREKQLSFEF
jgi:hypothetical protein